MIYMYLHMWLHNIRLDKHTMQHLPPRCMCRHFDMAVVHRDSLEV